MRNKRAVLSDKSCILWRCRRRKRSRRRKRKRSRRKRRRMVYIKRGMRNERSVLRVTRAVLYAGGGGREEEEEEEEEYGVNKKRDEERAISTESDKSCTLCCCRHRGSVASLDPRTTAPTEALTPVAVFRPGVIEYGGLSDLRPLLRQWFCWHPTGRLHNSCLSDKSDEPPVYCTHYIHTSSKNTSLHTCPISPTLHPQYFSSAKKSANMA